MVKVKQKSPWVSHAGGCQRFGRIRGYLSTARKHAKNVFEAIRDAFEGTLSFLPQKCRKADNIGASTYWVVTFKGANRLRCCQG